MPYGLYMKINKIFFSLIIYTIVGCSNPDKNLIVGKYGMDKFRLRDVSAKRKIINSCLLKVMTVLN